MQSGMITSENISQILRGISQKRQHGVLEVVYPESQFQILFNAGRIVDAVSSEQNSVQEVVGMLRMAGLIKTVPAEGEISSYKELFLWLNNDCADLKSFDEQTFRRIVKHRVLDALYEFSLKPSGMYNFKIAMPEYDRDFSPSVSVGQFLLDCVSLEAESTRFERLFPDGSRVIRLDTSGITLTEDEQILYELIGKGISKDELIVRGMISRYTLQSALLGMHERALIEVEVDHSENEPAHLSRDILSVLEDSSERPYVESELKPSKEEGLNQIVQELDSENVSEVRDEEDKNETQDLEEIEQVISEVEPEFENGIVVDEHHSKFELVNARLLNSNRIPNVLIFVFLLWACLSVLLNWNEIWAAF